MCATCHAFLYANDVDGEANVNAITQPEQADESSNQGNVVVVVVFVEQQPRVVFQATAARTRMSPTATAATRSPPPTRTKWRLVRPRGEDKEGREKSPRRHYRRIED